MVGCFKSPLLRQIWVCSGVLMGWISQGNSFGFTATFLPQLREDAGFQLTKEMESWIASMLGFGLTVGTIMMPAFMSKFGRRKANIFSIVTLGAGWFLLLATNNVYLILVARFLKGLGMGKATVVNGISIAEYTSPKNRGILAIISMSVAFTVGVLFVHVVGLLFPWKVTAALCSVFPVLGTIIFATSPETPFWLASKGRYEESRDSFHWLRGNNYKVNQELDALISSSTKDNLKRSIENTFMEDLTEFFAKLGNKELLKPLLLVAHLFILSQLSGVNVFLSFSVDIMKSLVGEDVDITVWLVTVDLLRLLGVFIAAVIVRRYKRRTVLYSSAICTTVSMLALSLCSYLKTIGHLEGTLIIKILVYVYAFVTVLGVVSVPFAMASELFPMKVKAIGSCLGYLVLNLTVFVLLQTAPALLNSFKFHGLYLLYAFAVIYCLVVLWFTLPETKDRTLQDIELDFKNVSFEAIPTEKEEALLPK